MGLFQDKLSMAMRTALAQIARCQTTSGSMYSLYSISAFFSWSIDNPVGPTVAGQSVKVWIHRWSWYARIIHIDSDSSSIHQSIQNMSKLFGQQPFPIYIYKQQFAIIRDLRRLWPAIYEIDIKSRVFQEFFKTLWSWGKLLFEDGEPLTFPEFMDAILTLRGSNQTTVKDRMGHARCCNHQPAVLGIIQYRFSWELKKIITVFTGNSLN